ncbi:YajQ family cyclic di-GMP-binding protein [Candidatus Saccharibacteria bacterium]|nr:YajQ family cyclic di-GMP-binding protein [Candidatus Saccharibacteria bacterium]
MAGNFSFDIVSEFDKGEMNNVLDQVQREVTTRYDLKGTSSNIDWLNSEKNGFLVTGDNQFHLDAIIEMVRKKAATRGVSQKTFDTSKEPTTSNMKMTWEITFKKGLDQEKAKKITALLRDRLPKVKAQIQGEEVRVMSPKKDELQQAMQLIRDTDFDFPVSFTNFR